MPAPLVRSEGTDSANKRNRWTPEEVELLGKIVVEGEGSRKAAIMNASSRGDDRDLRRAAWISVANEFNEKAIDLPEGFSGFRKSADQVKKKWSSTKSEAKNSFAAAKAATMATGGGRAGVKDIHQNFLLGLTDTELQGFTTESFGSVNLNAAEAVAATVNLDEVIGHRTSRTSKTTNGYQPYPNLAKR